MPFSNDENRRLADMISDLMELPRVQFQARLRELPLQGWMIKMAYAEHAQRHGYTLTAQDYRDAGADRGP
jgi:DNA-binding HxlR family transcriptional regulator